MGSLFKNGLVSTVVLLLTGCALQLSPSPVQTRPPPFGSLTLSTSTATPSPTLLSPVNTPKRPESPGSLTWISVAGDGIGGNDTSEAPAISENARYVAFVSFASNLGPGNSILCSTIAGQPRSCANIFAYDRHARMMKRISESNEGVASNRNSGVVEEIGSQVSISADGRWIVFHSEASNLVTQSYSSSIQVYAYDQQVARLQLISANSNGMPGDGDSAWPTVSADGRFVAFVSSADNLALPNTNHFCGPSLTSKCPDVFVRDQQTNTIQVVSLASDGTPGNGESGHWYPPKISADGRYVAFWSAARNLVPGDTNNVADIFVRDRQSGTTTRVSVATDGTQADGDSTCPSLSADGRYVAYASEARTLVPGDTNNVADIFVRDRQSGTTTRVSVSTDSTQADGRSRCPSISADGRYVTFVSAASNLATDNPDRVENIFVRDRLTNKTELISMAPDGKPGNQPSASPTISADGRYIAFKSLASNLIIGKTHKRWDIFLYERGNPP